MKPDDKFPEEMLDDIREAAVKTSCAARDLSSAVADFMTAYPVYQSNDRFIMWWKMVADRAMIDCAALANEAEELADAEGKQKLGGEE